LDAPPNTTMERDDNESGKDSTINEDVNVQKQKEDVERLDECVVG